MGWGRRAELRGRVIAALRDRVSLLPYPLVEHLLAHPGWTPCLKLSEPVSLEPKVVWVFWLDTMEPLHVEPLGPLHVDRLDLLELKIIIS